MENIGLIFAIVVLYLYIIIFVSVMVYLKEKNKCNHVWETRDIQNWNSSRCGEYLKIIQECTKCGKIQVTEK
jgi:hypothetical protein